jgi:DNA-binding CsgD family transcriptional regulator
MRVVIAGRGWMAVRAARLLAALMEGEDTRSYAEKNRISYETVRYHLKTAYALTGIRSQARLLQVISRSVDEFDELG